MMADITSQRTRGVGEPVKRIVSVADGCFGSALPNAGSSRADEQPSAGWNAAFCPLESFVPPKLLLLSESSPGVVSADISRTFDRLCSCSHSCVNSALPPPFTDSGAAT